MASNPYFNKVQFGSTVLIDLTGDTVSASDVRSGSTFHTQSGAVTTGTAELVYNASEESLTLPSWAVTLE